MRIFLCLTIFAAALFLSTQAEAISDKEIGEKCYKSYRSGRSNQGVACVYLKCQKKYEKKHINDLIKCQDTANKVFLDSVARGKGKDKEEKDKKASRKKASDKERLNLEL